MPGAELHSGSQTPDVHDVWSAVDRRGRLPQPLRHKTLRRIGGRLGLRRGCRALDAACGTGKPMVWATKTAAGNGGGQAA